MTVQELYSEIDGDYKDALSRLMKDSLVERFMLKFLNDKSYDELIAAVAAGNIPDSFRAAHTLKGVAANLGFKGLQMAASELTEQLRSQTEPADKALLNNVKAAYAKVTDGLKRYQNA